MQPITLSQAQAVPDQIDQTRFTVEFGAIPGGGNSEGLTIKCFSAIIPGASTEVYETNMGGHKRRFSGRKLYPNILSFSFYEDASGDTFIQLLQWLEFTRGSESGNSGDYIDGYAIQARIAQYDTVGVETNVWIPHRCFPFDLQDTQLSTESSQAVQVQVQMSYDFFESTATPMM